MALVQRPKKEADNFDARYNQKTWDEVKALAPNLPISALASELELEHAATMVVSEPDALKKLNELYQEKNLWVISVFVLRLYFLKISLRNEQRILANGGSEYGVQNTKLLTVVHIVFYLSCLSEAVLKQASFDGLSVLGLAVLAEFLKEIAIKEAPLDNDRKPNDVILKKGYKVSKWVDDKNNVIQSDTVLSDGMSCETLIKQPLFDWFSGLGFVMLFSAMATLYYLRIILGDKWTVGQLFGETCHPIHHWQLILAV